TPINKNTERLNASINAGGTPSAFYFQYGPTLGLGSLSSTNYLPFGAPPVSANALITGLAPNSFYYYRPVLANGSISVTGSVLNFTTLANDPSAPYLDHVQWSNGIGFTFSFTNIPNVPFTVLTTTNLMLPLSNWFIFGPAVESPA